MLEIGKLYICEEFFLLLYPDKEAAGHRPLAVGSADAAAGSAAYWTRKLGKSVSYTDKNIPLLSLNNKEKYVEVLAGDRKGWIVVEDWLGIKEIVV